MRRGIGRGFWVGLVVVGCAGTPAPTTAPPELEARPVELQDPPLWGVAAAWTADGGGLVLLDPGRHRLLVYGLDGALRESVALDPFVELDYSTPIRLERQGEGFRLGDRRRLLTLDRELVPGETVELFGPNGVASDGSLGDFVLDRDGLVGWSDWLVVDGSSGGGDSWRRGFVRLTPGSPGSLEPLLELGLEDREFAEYYYYSRRPYVVALGGRILLLRQTTPPALDRAGRRGLRRVATLETDGRDAVALVAWRDRLYLLLTRPQGLAVAARLVEAGAPQEEVRATLARAERVEATAPTPWWLRRIDPKSGATLAETRLPATARSLRLVPGDTAWAVLEETDPVTGDGSRGRMRLSLIEASAIP